MVQALLFNSRSDVFNPMGSTALGEQPEAQGVVSLLALGLLGHWEAQTLGTDAFTPWVVTFLILVSLT